MVWKIASLYIVSMIGAGFASGQEAVQFFAVFGWSGLIGLLIATSLLSIFGMRIVNYCAVHNTTSYLQVLQQLTKVGAPYLDVALGFFLFAGLAIMLAGSNEAILHLLSIEGGRYITASLVLLVLMQGPGKVMAVSSWMTGPLVLIMMLIGVRTICIETVIVPTESVVMGPLYGLLYAGYNLGFALTIFAGVGPVLPSGRQAKIGGGLGGAVLGLLLSVTIFALWSTSPLTLFQPIPMLMLANRWSGWIGAVYGLILWCAMYTTAIANTLALSMRVRQMLTLPNPLVCIVLVGTASLASNMGFVYLIKVAYPLFGYIGVYLMYRIYLITRN